MSKHIVFVVHGMGTASTGWSTSAIKALKDNAKAIKYPLDIKNDFEFIEINYDHIFLSYINQHNKNAKSLATYMSTGQLGAASSFYRGLFEYAAGSLKNEDFVVSALGDVFLYRLSDYSEVVRNFVISTFTTELNKRGRPRWSVIAHSLGTRVVHDALDDFLSTANNRNVFKKPVALCNIANVIHLLAYSPSTLWKKTGIWPSKLTTKGACFRYVNALHPADPFTWVREFDPTPDWGNDAEYSGLYMRPAIALKEITRANTHSFEGYLENPKVSAAICWALGTANTLKPPYDPDELIKRTAKYAQKTIVGQAEKAWKKAEKLRQERDLTSFRNFVSAISDFEKFIKSLGESILD